jgi:preprotein translocase subunit SecD
MPAAKPATVIQLRSVTSSIDGACREAPLLSAGAGPACSWDAKTGYQLGAKVADLTVMKAVIADEDAGGVSTGMPIVRVHLDETSTLQLSTVSKDLVGKTVAFLIGGRVVEAPIISAQIKNGDIAILPASPAADAQAPSPTEYTRLLHQVATALGAK